MWSVRLLVVNLLLLSGLCAQSSQQLNVLGPSIKTPDSAFRKPWPRTVYGPQTIGLKTRYDLSKNGNYVFESAHYRYVSNAKIEPKVVQHFAVLFESTYKYVMALPLNATAQYLSDEGKLAIYLFGDFDSYHRSGGPSGSAGVYMPSTNSVLVPLPVLGVQWTGKKWVIRKGAGNHVLSHELAHQLTAGVNYASWYLEGSAEYVASTRYTHGAYHPGNGKQRVFDYIRSKDGLKDGSGRRLGSRLEMMELERFMNLPYRVFAASDANKNYGIGLLLSYYFYHKDGRGDGARMKQYIKAIQQGESEVRAQKLLLGSRSYKQLQDEFKKFCAQGGLTLVFK